MNRVFVLLTAMFAVTGTLPAIAQKNDKPRFLYVQNAQSMTLRNGTLTLKNVSPLTLFFSDRPKRIAGHMRTEDFIKHWNTGANSFKASPPNATISVFRDANHITDGIVELSDPKVNGPDLSFKVKMLLGELPAEANELSVFIDSGDAACDVDTPYAGEPCWAQEAFNCGDRGGC